MVCSCCKGHYPHKHDRRNCPMNKFRKKKPKQGPKALEGLSGCMNIFREPSQKKVTKVRRPIEGLADCNLFKGTKVCGLCGVAGHNRRTCEKQWADVPEFLGPMTSKVSLQDPVDKFIEGRDRVLADLLIPEESRKELLLVGEKMGLVSLGLM